MRSPDTDNLLRAVRGTSANDVHAVGWEMLRYDGAEWSAVSGAWVDGSGVWSLSPSDGYAVGIGGSIAHYDGSAWNTMNSPTGESLDDVWGFSADDVYAVANDGSVLHYSGSAWSVVSKPAVWLSAIWGTSSTDLYAGGEGIFHYDGSTWSNMGAPGGG